MVFLRAEKCEAAKPHGQGISENRPREMAAELLRCTRRLRLAGIGPARQFGESGEFSEFSDGSAQFPAMAGDHPFLVGRDHHSTSVRLPARLMLMASPVLAVSSMSMPSQSRPSQMRRRTSVACSPIPPVKTSASMPPMQAASAPSSRTAR